MCIAEILILFVSRAQMQVPSSSTIPESAVCIGLWETGVGFFGGWMPVVVLLEPGALTERARGAAHAD